MNDSSVSPLKVAVIGTGHLGKQHVRLYNELPEAELVAISDLNEETVQGFAREYGVPGFTDYKKLPDDIQAVSVSVPTVNHFEVSSYFLKRGVHVLVEKPITHTIEEAKQLIHLGREAGVNLQVGHVERFNPALLAIDRLGVKPAFIESHRISPFRFRSIDIGVVMDLMIHDLDIILHLVNSPVKSIDAMGVNVLGDLEDIASARIVFENGCVANLTASRVSMKTQRTIRIFSKDSYISLDYGAKKASVYRKTPGIDLKSLMMAAAAKPSGGSSPPPDFSGLLACEEVVMDREEPLKNELRSFLQCVHEKRAPVVPGEHGMRALEASFEIMQQIQAYLAEMTS